MTPSSCGAVVNSTAVVEGRIMRSALNVAQDNPSKQRIKILNLGISDVLSMRTCFFERGCRGVESTQLEG